MNFRLLALVAVSLALSACNITGSGQKGPFKAGSTVTASRLNKQAAPISSSTLTTRVRSNKGNFSVTNIKWKGWTELTITGQYFDEFAGADSSESLSLNAITRKDRRFDTANVHLFSHLAAARIKQRVANGQNRNRAWKSTQREMKRLFGLKRVSRNYHRGVEQVNLLRGSGNFRKDNANLLLFTGSFLATGGDAATLAALTSDFADDAQFNGVGLEAFTAIASKASTSGLLKKLSQNLKRHGVRNPPNNGDMRRLPKWVIEDAGDVTPPVITVTGQNPITIEVGSTYVDEGATATDDVDGEVAATVVDGSDDIDTSEAGTHTVTYEAIDDAGNRATATREVEVTAVADTTPPVITVTGDNPVSIVAGTAYVDAGATAVDNVDGELAATAINGSEIIDTTSAGTHTVTYEATDTEGNTATATRTVVVTAAPDVTAPVITLLGDSPVIVEVDTSEVPVAYVDAGTTVSDDHDESVEVRVTGLDLVDTSKVGDYEIAYNAHDLAGNNAVVVTRLVKVVDTVIPVITLTGEPSLVVQMGSTYTDAGATATDNYDGALATIVIVNPVNTHVPATYQITYNVSDSSENAAAQVTRSVRVNLPPSASAGADVSAVLGTAIDLQGSASDGDGAVVSYQWMKGELALAPASDSPAFTYTVNTVGDATLTLVVTDNDGAVASDTVIIKGTLPPPPEIVFVTDTMTVPRNLDASLFQQGLLLAVSVVDNGVTLAVEPSFDATQVDLTTPGSYPLVFSFTDSFDRTITKTLTVIVSNATPIAVGQSISTDEDTSSATITLVGTDSDRGDTLTYRISQQPAHGSLTGDVPAVVYTPEANYHGADSFKFEVSDGIEKSEATVNITVNSINDAPTANAGRNVNAFVGDSVTLRGSGNDPDSNSPVTYQWLKGETVIAGATSANYSFTATVEGTFTYTLQVTDVDGATATDTVDLEVSPNRNATPERIEFEENPFVVMVGEYTSFNSFYYSMLDTVHIIDSNDEDYLGRDYSFEPYDPLEAFDISVPGEHTLQIIYSENRGQQNEVYLSKDITIIVESDEEISTAITSSVVSTTGEKLSGIKVDILQKGISLTSGNQAPNFVTDLNGQIAFELPSSSEYTLVYTANGYANQIQVVTTPAQGDLAVNVTMIPRARPVTVLTTAPVVGTDGASVLLDNNSFVDSQGNPVEIDGNNIVVSITPVDVTSPAGLAAFPGEFTGISNDQAPTPIVSYGTVEYHFTLNGEELQLGDGQSATINLPIYSARHQDGSLVAAGDLIPLWSLNEKTGIWLQEGTGTVVTSTASPTGFAMQATVSHFTWWNVDAVMNEVATAVVTVNSAIAGSAVIKVRIADETTIGWRSSNANITTTIGTATSPLSIPSNTEVCFWSEVSFANSSTAITPESCNTASPGQQLSVTLAVSNLPLEIAASSTTVAAYLTVAAPEVTLRSTTPESTVTYSIDAGALPAGLTMSPTGSTTASIKGTPTESGTFNPVIKAVDADGNVKTIALTYNVSSDIPPPNLQAGFITPGSGVFTPSEDQGAAKRISTQVSGSLDTTEQDYSITNNGGAATTWNIVFDSSKDIRMGEVVVNGRSARMYDIGSIPGTEFNVSIDSATGVVTIVWPMGHTKNLGYRVDYELFAVITVTNGSGTTTRPIRLIKPNGVTALDHKHDEEPSDNTCHGRSIENIQGELGYLESRSFGLDQQLKVLEERGDFGTQEALELRNEIASLNIRINVLYDMLDSCTPDIDV